MEITNGWLDQARRCPSPNCDERAGDRLDLIVIHNISLPPGEFGGPGIDQLFTNTLDPSEHPYYASIAGMRVSAHLLIRRNGECVQYVPFDLRAWHAGESRFGERTACNEFSVGIELEGTDDLPYETEQYECLATVVKTLINAYPDLDGQRIAGHSDIAPGRKTDPGDAFDWTRFRRSLQALQ